MFAQEKTDIYNVTVPVENQLEPQRQAAFGVALHEMVDTLSANPNVKASADLSELYAHPELYVASYSYQSDSDQEEGLKIIVHFDREVLSPFFPQQQRVAQSQPLELQVSGIMSASILNAMMHDLNQMNVLKSVMIEQVKGENVQLSIVLQGNEANFIQTLLANQHFVTLSAEDPHDQAALRFKWIGE